MDRFDFGELRASLGMPPPIGQQRRDTRLRELVVIRQLGSQNLTHADSDPFRPYDEHGGRFMAWPSDKWWSSRWAAMRPYVEEIAEARNLVFTGLSLFLPVDHYVEVQFEDAQRDNLASITMQCAEACEQSLKRYPGFQLVLTLNEGESLPLYRRD